VAYQFPALRNSVDIDPADWSVAPVVSVVAARAAVAAYACAGILSGSVAIPIFVM